MASDEDRRAYLLLQVELDQDQTNFDRSVYAILDYFGDVGGLLGFLSLFGKFLMSFSPTESTSNKLVRRLFKK